MKATELRIGNKFECMGMVQTVFEICDNTDRGKYKQKGYEHIIRCEENGNQYKPIEISGIQLTEEWLLKLGFVTCYDDYEGEVRQYIKYPIIWVASDHYRIYNQWCFDYEIKYVHQLQNLYFALTGKELKLKL